MDALDRKILSLLQDDGRTSVTDLAAQVRLSLSACHRRVRELERCGAIKGYRALIHPRAVGLEFEAIVFVTMGCSNPSATSAFEDAVAALPSIVEAERLFGQPDYMLRVLVRDLNAYQEFYDRELGDLPGVQRLTSTMVMKRIGAERSVPVTLS